MPTTSNINFIIGNLLIYKKQTKQAVTLFKRVLELAPDYPDALNNLGIALNAGGCKEEDKDA